MMHSWFRLVCQWTLFVLLVFQFFVSTYINFNGRKPLSPTGFRGFLTTISVIAFGFVLYWGAGAFDMLLELFQ